MKSPPLGADFYLVCIILVKKYLYPDVVIVLWSEIGKINGLGFLFRNKPIAIFELFGANSRPLREKAQEKMVRGTASFNDPMRVTVAG